ncbi:hypothetical protein ABPG72_020472 [Tetrahymena utriculariae]
MENYQLCATHNLRLNILKIENQENEYLLKCLDCLLEQPFKCVPLVKFIDSDFNTLIKGWPIIDDSQIYNQLKGMKQKEDFMMQEIKKILSFYQKLKQEIISLIEKKEKDTLKDFETRYENYEYPIDLYNKISQKEKLKDIIFNQYQNQDTKNKIRVEGVKQIVLALETLQNINHLVLDLSMNDVEVEGAKQIALALEKLKNITKLTLNLSIRGYNINSINVQGAKEIALALEKLLNITNLTVDFSGNDICDQGAKQIALALEKLQNLTNLTLDFSQNSISLEGTKQISLALEKLQNLTNLTLLLGNFSGYYSGNRLQVEGALQMALALQKLKNITYLTLNFSKNDIFDEGVKEITLTLQKLLNITNLTLILNENKIQEEGARQISLALEKQKNLTNLTLKLNQNNIQAEGVKHITSALEKLSNITITGQEKFGCQRFLANFFFLFIQHGRALQMMKNGIQMRIIRQSFHSFFLSFN